MSLTFILIGEDNLLIECAKYILEQNHLIQYVISSLETIQDWCKQQSIEFSNSLDKMLSLEENSVDAIFSIVNGVILKSRDLKIARFGAINYHDSILPQYAGLHATTWAILNNEKQHGITWHKINERIDEGDILYQTSFPISEHDTALTLNVRCYEEAITGFKKVLTDFQNDNFNPITQNLSKKSYFGIGHVLPNMGFIDWKNMDAECIFKIFRALSFGHTRNSVGCLKLILSDISLIIDFVEISKEKFRNADPGTILALDYDCMLISTLSATIRVGQFRTLSGQPVTLGKLVERYQLKIGYQFYNPDQLFTENHRNLYSKALKSESYWKNQFLHSVSHATFNNHSIDTASDYTKLCSLNIPGSSNVIDKAPLLLASILIYLYRINDYVNFTFTLKDDSHFATTTNCMGLFSNDFPNKSCFNSIDTLNDVLIRAKSLISRIQINTPYCSDLFARHPELQQSSNINEITIVFTDILNSSTKKSLIHFEIEKVSQQLSIFHKIATHSQGGLLSTLLSNMQFHIMNIFNQLINNPEFKIYEFSLITDAEKRQLLSLGTGKPIPLPSNSVVDLFELQVLRTPTAVAVKNETQSFSYTDIWNSVNSVHRLLQKVNLQQQGIIAISFKLDVDFLILCLGILKAGFVCALVKPGTDIETLQTLALRNNIDCFISSKKTSESSLDQFDSISLLNLCQNPSLHFSEQYVDNLTPMKKMISADTPAFLILTTDNVTTQSQWLSHKIIINKSALAADQLHCRTNNCSKLTDPAAVMTALSTVFSSLLIGATLNLPANHPKYDCGIDCELS